MQIRFKYSSFQDLDLYMKCFNNEEFLYMLYPFNPMNDAQLQYYITPNNTDLKFVCSIMKDSGKIVDFGFAHFYFKEGKNYTYVGGLIPEYFNSGLGVYASIAVLDYMFGLIDGLVITTGVYKYNIRCVKMLKKIGFLQIAETDEKLILKITKSDYENQYNTYLKHRFKYSIIK